MRTGMRFWVVACVMLMACCSSGDPAPPAVVTDYFPIKVGAYFIYAVDSLVTDQTIPTPYTYDLMLQVTDSFPSSEGGYIYVIQRSKRADSTKPWSSLTSWSIRLTPYQAVVDEGNTPYVKMETPIANGTAWNGNALNNLNGGEKCLDSDDNTCDIYALANVGKPYALDGGLSFQNSLTVVQSDNENLIVYQDRRSEVYALKTGLVYREIIQLNYCTDDSCRGQQIVDTGLNYTQQLKAYGGL